MFRFIVFLVFSACFKQYSTPISYIAHDISISEVAKKIALPEQQIDEDIRELLTPLFSKTYTPKDPPDAKKNEEVENSAVALQEIDLGKLHKKLVFKNSKYSNISSQELLPFITKYNERAKYCIKT